MIRYLQEPMRYISSCMLTFEERYNSQVSNHTPIHCEGVSVVSRSYADCSGIAPDGSHSQHLAGGPLANARSLIDYSISYPVARVDAIVHG